MLRCVPVGHGHRYGEIAQAVYHGRATLQQEVEVRLILRGLEHFGLVHESGGWWSREPEREPDQLSLGASE